MPFVSEWDVKALFNRSTICIGPLPQGAPWRCRLGCEHDTLRLLLLRPHAGTQPIRPTCMPIKNWHQVQSRRQSITYLAPSQNARGSCLLLSHGLFRGFRSRKELHVDRVEEPDLISGLVQAFPPTGNRGTCWAVEEKRESTFGNVDFGISQDKK